MNVIYLFGIHVSGSASLLAHEPIFLSRAIHGCSTNPVQKPYQIIHHIQAQVLLAHFFLGQGILIHAMHRINAAVSLCIAYGLHKQQKTRNSNILVQLDPTSDPVEEGERIDALWTVLALSTCWTVALQWHSAIPDILMEEVDIPWPLDVVAYEQVSPH